MKTKVKYPRHRNTWGYWAKKRKFGSDLTAHTEARIYNTHPLDEGVDEFLFVNTIAMFGFYGIFLRAPGVSALIASRHRLDRIETSLLPYGEYCRNAPNEISETKLGPFATTAFGEHLVEYFERLVRKNLRAIRDHLARPREFAVLGDGLHQEQGST